MVDLNNIEGIRKYDPKDVFGSTELFTKQCEQIWKDAQQLLFPEEYTEIQNIVICGMGGSAYGGHIIPSLYKDVLPYPITLISDYHIPGFVSDKTLVILTSYSGSTEEVLSCAQEAFDKSAKVTILTSGDLLAQFAKQHSAPSLIFASTNNPSGQPRLGTGYIVFGTIAMLTRLNLISLDGQEAQNAVEETNLARETIKQNAISLAQKIQGTIPVIMAGEFLFGNAHIIRNQFNETSKSFSAYSLLPELNHHLMEGLKNPADKKLAFLTLESELYSPSVQKRMLLTKDVVGKNNITVVSFKPTGKTKLSQVLQTLSFGGYLTFYLAILYGQDPSLIPWVDYFKEQLKKA